MSGDYVPPIRGYTNFLTIAKAFARLRLPLEGDWGTKELRRAVEQVTERKILEVLFQHLEEGRLRGMDTSYSPEIPFDRSIHTTPMKAAFVGFKGPELEKAVSLLLGDSIASASADTPPNLPQRARTKAQQHEEAILAKLAELGFERTALPRRPRGKKWPVKQQVQAALRKRMGQVQFEKAWQRLREKQCIREV